MNRTGGDRYWALIALALAGGLAVGVGGVHVWRVFVIEGGEHG